MQEYYKYIDMKILAVTFEAYTGEAEIYEPGYNCDKLGFYGMNWDGVLIYGNKNDTTAEKQNFIIPWHRIITIKFEEE